MDDVDDADLSLKGFDILEVETVQFKDALVRQLNVLLNNETADPSLVEYICVMVLGNRRKMGEVRSAIEDLLGATVTAPLQQWLCEYVRDLCETHESLQHEEERVHAELEIVGGKVMEQEEGRLRQEGGGGEREAGLEASGRREEAVGYVMEEEREEEGRPGSRKQRVEGEVAVGTGSRGGNKGDMPGRTLGAGRLFTSALHQSVRRRDAMVFEPLKPGVVGPHTRRDMAVIGGGRGSRESPVERETKGRQVTEGKRRVQYHHQRPPASPRLGLPRDVRVVQEISLSGPATPAAPAVLAPTRPSTSAPPPRTTPLTTFTITLGGQKPTSRLSRASPPRAGTGGDVKARAGGLRAMTVSSKFVEHAKASKLGARIQGTTQLSPLAPPYQPGASRGEYGPIKGGRGGRRGSTLRKVPYSLAGPSTSFPRPAPTTASLAWDKRGSGRFSTGPGSSVSGPARLSAWEPPTTVSASSPSNRSLIRNPATGRLTHHKVWVNPGLLGEAHKAVEPSAGSQT
ncbi:hypothetical protein NSK_006872 [Nannochloropsis salina CCMP1776]|uniref:PWI domain-containing protein n=1 Tax=Nannochloropsis salina CCMP1776 TaxID=1027361 RepID=A0A4D9CQZ3_9STRA|nr:hypothetical protein NSK_006872 [Nannochloropsis salina CCMP1776]|eukprot:TFJ81621.1 hypothetical protein NSK_006872 [Nannochloropsis salina CCMP1776]